MMEENQIITDKFAGIDEAIGLLTQHKKTWATLAIPEKIKMLLKVRKNIGDYAQEWVDLSVKGKQLPPDSPLAGEEWTSGPWVLASSITNYIETLEAIYQGKKAALIKKTRNRPDGQLVVKVFPNNIYDNLLLNGIRAEVWMQEGVTAENLANTIGTFYNKEDPDGKVSLVLGAGNINAIAPLDVLYKLIADGEVVILKMNPVNEYLGPVLEKILAPFIEADYVKLVYGGAEVGEYLTRHPGIGTIHITGSERTHDIIVYGAGEEGRQRKKENKPILDQGKSLTSELGGIGPMIVVPGPWTKADINFQADNIVSAKLHNGGHNCVASQVLVMPEKWDLSQTLIDTVTEKLANIPPRIAYYPGTDKNQEAALNAYPEAQLFGGDVPRTFIKGLTASNDEYAFTHEFFGPVYAQTDIEGDDAASFLSNAVKFCNEKLHGTLGATILIHPQTKKEMGPEFENIVAGLRYGAIGVNIWNAVAFLVTQCTWGAFPGHSFNDIQSGVGVVHNTFLFDKPQKTIAYGPFRALPRAWVHGDFNLMPYPLWFVTNKTAHITAKRITKFAVNPGFKHLPGIFIAALRG
jgi:aldehyde dehydrogenase (NAD(P)+)